MSKENRKRRIILGHFLGHITWNSCRIHFVCKLPQKRKTLQVIVRKTNTISRWLEKVVIFFQYLCSLVASMWGKLSVITLTLYVCIARLSLSLSLSLASSSSWIFLLQSTRGRLRRRCCCWRWWSRRPWGCVALIFKLSTSGLARRDARVWEASRLLCALDVLLDDFALGLGRLQAVQPQTCLFSPF